jgi:hypothetical protein
VFAHLSLPSIPDVSRRTLTGALVVGVAALVASVSFGHPLVGLGACVGLALGTFNFRLIGNSVAKVGSREDGRTRGPLAVNTAVRMGIITVITLGLLIVAPQIGFGILGGLVAFQLILLVNVARSMMKTGGADGIGEVIDVEASEPVVEPWRHPDPPVLGGGAGAGTGEV